MKIKPFKGIRPPKELVEQVSSRPYDVLNSEEAQAEAAGNEMSLYHIIKPEINFNPLIDEHDPRVYPEALSQYKRFRAKGWLVQDLEEKYYVYAQTILASNPLSGGKDKTQYGLVVGAWVDDYLEGRIKKHELTRRDKEEDRMKHVRTLNANMEPVFFAYPHRDDLDAIIEKVCKQTPEYDFVAHPDIRFYSGDVYCGRTPSFCRGSPRRRGAENQKSKLKNQKSRIRFLPGGLFPG